MNILNIFTLDFWIGLMYMLPGIIIGLSFHEFAHAYAAHKMGDDTALALGRMTLNPLAHIDVVGFICMIFLGFGWAKPVPVNSNNYKGNRKKADIIVSLAGITMNLIIAVIAMFLFFFLMYICKVTNNIILNILFYVVYINLCLMVFNLIPIPPLDGSHVLEDLLIPITGIQPFMFIRKYSMFILIGVLIVLNSSGILSTVCGFLADSLYKLFALVFTAYM